MKHLYILFLFFGSVSWSQKIVINPLLNYTPGVPVDTSTANQIVSDSINTKTFYRADGYLDETRAVTLGNFDVNFDANTFVIDGSANKVGIGTASPSEKLHIYSGILEVQQNNKGFILNTVNSASNSEFFYEVNGSSKFRLGTVNAATNTGWRLRDETAGQERIRIDHNGNIGISMTNPSVELDVTGDIEYTGTITDVSDERLKENIRTINNPIDRIMMLNGITFNMIGESRRSAGLSAQDVQKALPEAVSIVDPGAGTLGADYTQVIALLVEVVKEQQKQIELLKSKN